jgi:hypothetical protein
MSELSFRYVTQERVTAYQAMGWVVLGQTRSPHDAQDVWIVEWPAAEEPTDPAPKSSPRRTS